jgi:hypothetical protein
MNKPRSLRDQRRTEAREALYRAERRRDQIIYSLVQNADRISKLKRKLARLDMPVRHTGPVSVAEGKLLEGLDEVKMVTAMIRELDDDISDVPPCV